MFVILHATYIILQTTFNFIIDWCEPFTYIFKFAGSYKSCHRYYKLYVAQFQTASLNNMDHVKKRGVSVICRIVLYTLNNTMQKKESINNIWMHMNKNALKLRRKEFEVLAR